MNMNISCFHMYRYKGIQDGLKHRINLTPEGVLSRRELHMYFIKIRILHLVDKHQLQTKRYSHMIMHIDVMFVYSNEKNKDVEKTHENEIFSKNAEIHVH